MLLLMLLLVVVVLLVVLSSGGGSMNEWNELRNSSYQVILNIIPLLLACESMGSIQNGAGLPVRTVICVCWCRCGVHKNVAGGAAGRSMKK